MSGAHGQTIGGRYSLVLVVFATLAAFSSQAAEPKERKPLTEPGQTYVGIEVVGCAERCPSYEIYLLDNGRMLFRANDNTVSKGVTNRSGGYGSQYKILVEFLSSGKFFKEGADCSPASPGHTSVTVFSTVGGEQKRTLWNFGCAGDAENATALISKFVDKSGTWMKINRNWEYWQAHQYDTK
jgi:hypothetical protein